ncbi:MAG: hypothetical protein WHT06_14520 [Desulfobacterales bacterium]
MTWHRIAWGEVGFEIPDRWSPARIGSGELVFEEGGEVVLEVGWKRAGRGFSFARPLGDLRRRAARRGGVFLEQPVPGAPPALEARGFEWREKGRSTVGVLLFCRRCRTASLLQFPGGGSGAGGERIRRIVSSFRDHRDDGRRAWRLFDAEAILPARFRLRRSRFETGRFELEFDGPGTRLVLLRWAPAAVLLGRWPLADFAERFAGGEGLAFDRPGGCGPDVVEAWRRPRASGPARLLALLPRRRLRGIRVWHDAVRNRILGVRLETRRGVPPPEWEELCRSWRCLDSA